MQKQFPTTSASDSIETQRTTAGSHQRLEGVNHDLWIAALCLQHRLPLLSNDRDFDDIEGLQVVHW